MQCIHNKWALIRRPFRSLWKTNRKFIAKKYKSLFSSSLHPQQDSESSKVGLWFLWNWNFETTRHFDERNFKNKSFLFIYIHCTWKHWNAFYSDTQSTLALVDWMWSFIQYLLYLLYDYLLLDGSGCMVAKKRRQIILGGSTTNLFIIVFAAEK